MRVCPWTAAALRRKSGLILLGKEFKAGCAASRPCQAMLVLFETSVGYAIFKVDGRLRRWTGKAGVGQAKKWRDLKRGWRCSQQHGYLLCTLVLKGRGRLWASEAHVSVSTWPWPFGVLGSGLEDLVRLEVDGSRIGILQVMKGIYSECFEE